MPRHTRRRRLSSLLVGVATMVLAPSLEASARPPLPERKASPMVVSSPGGQASTTDEASELASLLSELATEAEAKGVSRTTFATATAGLTIDPTIVDLLENQPEHSRSVADYLALAVSETRIANGGEKLAGEATVLAAIEARHGVPRQTLVAIWGLESGYGRSAGTRSVVRSLATLALRGGRRADYGRRQLVAALEILEAGDVTPAAMVGSWAGAMGHTQFIPTTFLSHAVDFDGDGRRDLWGSHADALASTANYLVASGWQTGEPWGIEVALPEGFDYALTGLRAPRSLSEWSGLGVVRLGGGALTGLPAEGTVLVPAGASGPAFLVFSNFRAILRYNQSTSYALAIGHLADRLAGGPPFARPWPTGDRPLKREEREELQSLLVARGHSTGGIDGIIGPATREALRRFQQTIGLPADGHPTAELLQRLRETTSKDGSTPSDG
ncbi:MAG: lytic murein transglycosylase [Rhizobiales bacterium]|nr:lytic murein transglycosylase [Hyphomicrobiales bacterium]